MYQAGLCFSYRLCRLETLKGSAGSLFPRRDMQDDYCVGEDEFEIFADE